LAGDAAIADHFTKHEAETEDHERLVRERLEAREASPAKLKDIAGTVTGKAFVLFARSQPDTPGKLVTHAFSYEHMEEAAYDLLTKVAERAADSATVAAAQRIDEQERAMGARLAGCFDRAAQAALDKKSPDDLDKQLIKYLA